MKKFLIPMTMIAALVFTSCGDDASSDASDSATAENTEANEGGESTEGTSEASLVGSWQCTGIDMGQKIPADQKAMYDEMIAAMSYTFNEDGSLEVTSAMSEEPQKGTYTVKGDKIIGSMGSKTDTITMSTLTATDLVLEMEGMKMTFTRK